MKKGLRHGRLAQLAQIDAIRLGDLMKKGLRRLLLALYEKAKIFDSET